MSFENNLSCLNRYLNKLAQSNDFSHARFTVLQLIKTKNPVTLRQLADEQQVSMPTMSKLVDELQTQGLVIRAMSKEDARQRWIVPTQKGLLKLDEMRQKNQQHWQFQLKALNSAQKKQLENSLALLVDCVNQEQ